MADWTLILTTVGTAGVTAGLGYLGIRKSTDVTKDQIAAETTRAREQMEAETERLRAQHREDHLRNRQATYHALLTADRSFQEAMRFGTGDVHEAFEKFSHLGEGVQISALLA